MKKKNVLILLLFIAAECSLVWGCNTASKGNVVNPKKNIVDPDKHSVDIDKHTVDIDQHTVDIDQRTVDLIYE